MKNGPAIFVLCTALCAASLSYAGQVSPLASLGDAEKTYYEKVFDYSMETVKPGQHYSWASYSGNGVMTIGNTFISKSGATCRNFDETFTVQGKNGIDKGVGCKRRGQEGWCKLGLEKAQTCSFEDTTRMFGGVMIDTPNIGHSTAPINVPSADVGSSEGAGVSVNPSMPQSTYSSKDVNAKSYSDTVTGNAGKAAGSATANGLSWFTSTFLR